MRWDFKIFRKDHSVRTKIFDSVTMTSNFDLLLKKKSKPWYKLLSWKIWVFHITHVYSKWQDLLTLALTFEPKGTWLAYCSRILLMARPFSRTKCFILWPSPPTLAYFWKKLNLCIYVWTERDPERWQELGQGYYSRSDSLFLVESVLISGTCKDTDPKLWPLRKLVDM